MAEPKDIVIGSDDLRKGSAPSPFVGMGITRNLDIHTSPGVVFSNGKTTKQSGTTITGRPLWMAEDTTNGVVYCLDNSQKLYKSTDGGDSWTHLSGNTASGSGNGMAYYKDYIVTIGTTQVDLYGPLSSSPDWRNNWASVNSASSHPMFIGQDDVLYIGSGRYVDSIAETVGSDFTWNSSSTYAQTDTELDLPEGYTIKCISEIGTNLLLGTTSVFNDAKIFPWDRLSPSFDQPVSLPENGVHQMIASNNQVFVHAGERANIYLTNGVNYQFLAKIPLTRGVNTFIGSTGYPGAVFTHRDMVYFGISSGVSNPNPCGVWSVTKQGVVNLEYTISTGEDGSNAALWIGALLNRPQALTTLIGWYDAQSTAQGVDKVNAGVGYASYGAYFDSPMWQVGTPSNKRTFTKISFQLDRPLETGQGVRVAYRTSLGASFTTIDTIDYATYSGIQSKEFPAKITSVENVQLRISLTSGSAGSPRLKEIRLS